jgi:hypothetical protein
LKRSLRSSTERLIAALLLAAALPGGAPAGAQPDPALEARKELNDRAYQRELPDRPEEKPDRNSESSIPDGPSGGGPSVITPALGAGAVLGKVIFIVLLIVTVVLLAGWIVKAMAMRRGPESADAGPGEGAEGEAAAEPEPKFEDATRLAAEGRYAEAVHALLLAAIRHFAERARMTVQPSRTSRELVRSLPLAPDAREAFAELVRTVELSLFGGAPVAAEDYERNLARFQALTRRSA